MTTELQLEEMGHTPVTGASAAEALNILGSGREIDLLITDYSMAQTTGLQLAAAVADQWGHIPIIIASGFAELDDGREIKFGRLATPYSEVELAAAIEQAMVGPVANANSS